MKIDDEIEKLVSEFLDKKSKDPGYLFSDTELDKLANEIIESMNFEIEETVKNFLINIIPNSDEDGKN